MGEEVLIVGAGAAGLAAAGELAKAGVTTRVLEARSRSGGRIHTLSQLNSAPIELGAEFMHGKAPEIEQLTRRHHLAFREIADAHWQMDRGRFVPLENFWGKLSRVFERLPRRGHDESYREFLKEHCTLLPEAKVLATDFVEGFHAGDPERISAISLAQSEAASAEVDGTKQFRLAAGYGELVRAMQAAAMARGASFEFGHAVSRIEWKAYNVVVSARHGEEVRRFEARKLLVTLPLGVLQSNAVQFDPPLFQKEEAIRNLAMGNVIKVNLQLRPGLWPDDKDGFIHLASEHFPTWWKNRDVVTAWAGGPRADELAKCSPIEIIQLVSEALGHMFGIGAHDARSRVESVQFHDWRKDLFARGAYSYVPVGAVNAGRILARPIEQTLFFAGEATAQPGFQGTVHGAIESGLRAARETLKA